MTVTWSPAPALDRPSAVSRRALAGAVGMIAPVLADVAVTSTRRLLQRWHHRLVVASLLRRQLERRPRLRRHDRLIAWVTWRCGI
jgi:hypothetical protein